IEIACCSGIVPSDEHHIDELRDLEAAAQVPDAAWDYLYIAIERESRRAPGIPASVGRFLEHRATPDRLPPETELPSEMLGAELSRFSSLGVSQEAVNTFLAGSPVAVLDNVVLHAAGRGTIVVSSEEAYAAADATYRSLNELLAQAIESTRERLAGEIETAEQTQLITRVLAPLLLVVLAGLGFVVYRFARNREVALQREQDLLDARNRFMRMVSHELRTPATAISGFAEMLGSEWTSLTEPEIAEFLAIINRQSTHLSLLVDDLLTLSHLETGRLRLHLGIVNLKQATEDAVAMVDARYGIEVETTIDPTITLLADPDRLLQILRNLVENAAKYGKVDVAVSAAVVGKSCEIVIADSGPGVPPEMVKRIFRFWDRGERDGSRVRGYGMGLAIARHLARAMVGDLVYRPHEPVGSEFVLSLPLGPPDVNGGVEGAMTAPGVGQSRNVVV
nr:HAMP domain-containing sensor histidine kinase [Acidimicrobiia bacterium]